MVESPEHERRHVEQYVHTQASETVVHAEKISTVGVFGRKYDVWDVRTAESRWWVITNLMNLYHQDRFPSMDETLSFHIGVMMRLAERDRRTPEDDEADDLLPSAWRRFGQAVDANNLAVEPEDYQSVAIRCREALLAMVRDLSSEAWLLDEPRPKLASFKEWASLIFRSLAEGRLRSYLTSMAEKTWDLAVSLQHDTRADPISLELLLDGVRSVFDAVFLAVIRRERANPDPCPKCGSLNLGRDYRPDSGLDYPHFVVCPACGWETQAAPLCEHGAAIERAYFEEHGEDIVPRAEERDRLRGNRSSREIDQAGGGER